MFINSLKNIIYDSITFYFRTFQINKEMNLWNLQHSKPRLAIIQKTEAQKKHILSLINAKSVLRQQKKMQTSFRSTSKSSKTKQSRAKTFTPQKPSNFTPKRLTLTAMCSSSRHQQKLSPQNFSCQMQTHSKIFQNLQQTRQKLLAQQNQKLITRLIQTSSTLKRNVWIKQNQIDYKIKQNINKNKYVRPDYSKEAEKLMSPMIRKKFHLQKRAAFNNHRLTEDGEQRLPKFYNISNLSAIRA